MLAVGFLRLFLPHALNARVCFEPYLAPSETGVGMEAESQYE